ncbi:MAG: hypothetical protein HAW67_03840 [Endozoicomonadaceae bacterium]|nr:hypothetical protein [Endozoicomonadaceae bacterium]
MSKTLLTNEAQIYLNGGSNRETYTLYKSGSAENHRSSDDQTLKQALIQALSSPLENKEDQDNGVYRVRINDGHGYLVYKVIPKDKKATIFHYHWNYNLDLPLGVA